MGGVNQPSQAPLLATFSHCGCLWLFAGHACRRRRSARAGRSLRLQKPFEVGKGAVAVPEELPVVLLPVLPPEGAGKMMGVDEREVVVRFGRERRVQEQLPAL